MANRMIRFETQAGVPVQSGDVRLIPFTKALVIQLPGLPGGLIWNRPVSVLAISPDGGERLLPIEDKTRQVQISLFASAIMSVSVMAAIFKLVRRNKETK